MIWELSVIAYKTREGTSPVILFTFWNDSWILTQKPNPRVWSDFRRVKNNKFFRTCFLHLPPTSALLTERSKGAEATASLLLFTSFSPSGFAASLLVSAGWWAELDSWGWRSTCFTGFNPFLFPAPVTRRLLSITRLSAPAMWLWLNPHPVQAMTLTKTPFGLTLCSVKLTWIKLN